MKNAQKQNQISDGNPLYVLATSDDLVLDSFESGLVWFASSDAPEPTFWRAEQRFLTSEPS